jgi:hypothetical protein
MHRVSVIKSRVPARAGFLIMLLCSFLALSGVFSDEKNPSSQSLLERAEQGEANMPK